jgi:hypothetical protein
MTYFFNLSIKTVKNLKTKNDADSAPAPIPILRLVWDKIQNLIHFDAAPVSQVSMILLHRAPASVLQASRKAF